MQHYKHASRSGGDRGPAHFSASLAMARPSAADPSQLASPSILPGGAARGGDDHDGHDGREKGAMGTLDALMTPQPAIRAVGERQFLYIQVRSGPLPRYLGFFLFVPPRLPLLFDCVRSVALRLSLSL